MKTRYKYLLLVSIILVFFIFNFSGCKGEDENEKQITQQAAQPTESDKKAELESRKEIKPKEIAKEKEGKDIDN